MPAIVTNLFGRADDWTEDEVARAVRHFAEGGSPRTIAAVLGKPVERMETVFAALAAAKDPQERTPSRDYVAMAHRAALTRWGPPLAEAHADLIVDIEAALVDEIDAYCAANPIQRREFVRRCLALYLDWCDEDDKSEADFVRKYGIVSKEPRPAKRRYLDLHGERPRRLCARLPRALVAALDRRCEIENESRALVVATGLEWNLNMIAWDGEWVLFEDMVMARGPAA